MTATEAEDGSAVRNDWLLKIHEKHVKVKNSTQRSPAAPQPGVVTRPLPPPGG